MGPRTGVYCAGDAVAAAGCVLLSHVLLRGSDELSLSALRLCFTPPVCRGAGDASARDDLRALLLLLLCGMGSPFGSAILSLPLLPSACPLPPAAPSALSMISTASVECCSLCISQLVRMRIVGLLSIAAAASLSVCGNGDRREERRGALKTLYRGQPQSKHTQRTYDRGRPTDEHSGSCNSFLSAAFLSLSQPK